MTRKADIPLDMSTKGALVYENMETHEPGVFSRGNVVHVHDLVGFCNSREPACRKSRSRICGREKRVPEDGRMIELKKGDQ